MAGEEASCLRPSPPGPGLGWPHPPGRPNGNKQRSTEWGGRRYPQCPSPGTPSGSTSLPALNVGPAGPYSDPFCSCPTAPDPHLGPPGALWLSDLTALQGPCRSFSLSYLGFHCALPSFPDSSFHYQLKLPLLQEAFLDCPQTG